MKKIIFYISAVIALLLLINILRILTLGIANLSEYGFGFLVGKTILLFLFLLITFLTRKKSIKHKKA